MKILLAQRDSTIGDFVGNVAIVREAMGRAGAAGADVVAFPELFLPGYPPRDLVEKPSFIAANEHALRDVAALATDVAIVIGFIERNESGAGKRLFNSVAVCERGRVAAVARKSLLPTYDVFDEGRHFEPATTASVVTIAGKRVGLSICEDAWNAPEFWRSRNYSRDPIREQAEQGVDFFLNVSASPYSVGRGELRVRMFREHARTHGKPLLFVNLVGGNDELLFDGRSLVVDSAGALRFEGRAFAADDLLVDLGAMPPAREPFARADEEEVLDALVMGTRDYMRKCGFTRAVVGLSGGIDSSVVAAIAADAIGAANVLGVSMPSRYSSKGSLEDARALADALGIGYRVVPIDKIFQAYLETLAPSLEGRPPDTTEENVQARIRGNVLMALSNKFGHLVLTTGNKSELAVGYCTLYGDMSGGLALISDVPKTLVYALGRALNRRRPSIPENVFTKAPSAELRPNQTDQDSLPPYDALDQILERYVEKREPIDQILAQGFDEKWVRDTIARVERNEYKRKQAAPGLRVTSKAFGLGWRMPIAQKFREG
ncbi:MAG: NAD+ synthase [Planctomycetes bacterium]|nr:NAD+ synthase [Planctomycetota bacterium]MBI3845650.1 NAD+ synthase [Planctomycetota bacterium]